jgi:secondary thiamine-phosphate synthase enzyme
VQSVVQQSGVDGGLVSVFVPGSTAAITTMEYEPGGVQDLQEAIERLVPRGRPEGGDYAHNRLNHDDNAHAHLRASLLGPSLSIPLVRGSLVLGTWQQVVLIDFDDRPRERAVHVQITA